MINDSKIKSQNNIKNKTIVGSEQGLYIWFLRTGLLALKHVNCMLTKAYSNGHNLTHLPVFLYILYKNFSGIKVIWKHNFYVLLPKLAVKSIVCIRS